MRRREWNEHSLEIGGRNNSVEKKHCEKKNKKK